MLRLGLVSGSSGNVSARAGELVHITPAGLPYEQMTPADVVALAMDGTVVAGARGPSSECRVHLAVYAARPDALALVHTHSEHATAWSFRDQPLEMPAGGSRSRTPAPPGRLVLTAPFAPSGSERIAAAAVEALGDRDAVLLGRHGVVALGATPALALAVCVEVERRARAARR